MTSKSGCERGERTGRFENLSSGKQEIILRWVRENIRHRKTPLSEWTSYGLKHLMERDTGLYCTNSVFKDAMKRCGFSPTDPEALNWRFAISKRSPAFLPSNRLCV